MQATLILSSDFNATDVEFLTKALKTFDREFTLNVTVNDDAVEGATNLLHHNDIDRLLTAIRTNEDSFKGLINEEREILTGQLYLNLVDQVRYNGVSFDVEHNGEVLEDEDFTWTDAWTDQLHGDLLVHLKGIGLIMMFGTKMTDQQAQALVNGDVTIIGMELEDQQRVFSNYAKFVYDLVGSGLDTSNFETDISEGYDS